MSTVLLALAAPSISLGWVWVVLDQTTAAVLHGVGALVLLALMGRRLP